MIYVLAAEDSLMNPALFKEWGTAGIIIFVLMIIGSAFVYSLPKIIQIITMVAALVESLKESIAECRAESAKTREEREKWGEEREKFAEERRQLQVVVTKLKSRQWGPQSDPMHQSD